MRTPEQIRRHTTPKKYYAILAGFMGTVLGFFAWFGGWAILHQRQARLYPTYCKVALQSTTSRWAATSFMHGKRRPNVMPFLQYELMRQGNQDHHLDRLLLDRRLYPRHAQNPPQWVYTHWALAPVYSDPASLVLKWPIALELMTVLACFLSGAIADYRYSVAILTGVHMDGTYVATIDEYNREVKGDGMKYAVRDWSIQ